MIKTELDKHNFLFGTMSGVQKMCFLNLNLSDQNSNTILSFLIKPTKIQTGKLQFNLINISNKELDYIYDWILNGKRDVWLESINQDKAECWYFHDAELVNYYSPSTCELSIFDNLTINYDLLEIIK